jgi:hypothetical protein
VVKTVDSLVRDTRARASGSSCFPRQTSTWNFLRFSAPPPYKGLAREVLLWIPVVTFENFDWVLVHGGGIGRLAVAIMRAFTDQ